MQRLMFTGKLINRCNMSIIEKLKKLLSEVPPKWNQIRNIMDSNTLTKEDLATLAISLSDDYFCEYTDALDRRKAAATGGYSASTTACISLRKGIEDRKSVV